MLLLFSFPSLQLGMWMWITRAAHFFFSLLLAVSLLISAAISVDRLLALLLGLRYRHTVTLRRVWVVLVFFWLISAIQTTGSVCSDECQYIIHIIQSFINAFLASLSILLREDIYNPSLSTSSGSWQFTTRTAAKWRRESTEHSSIQEDSVQHSMGAVSFTYLLYSIYRITVFKSFRNAW